MSDEKCKLCCNHDNYRELMPYLEGVICKECHADIKELQLPEWVFFKKLISRIENLEKDNQEFYEEYNNNQDTLCRAIADILDSSSRLESRIEKFKHELSRVPVEHNCLLEHHNLLAHEFTECVKRLEKLEQKESK